jgi:hypothetical protein
MSAILSEGNLLTTETSTTENNTPETGATDETAAPALLKFPIHASAN